ncbi:unnamed protein product, partial [marine sediment metagenome]
LLPQASQTRYVDVTYQDLRVNLHGAAYLDAVDLDGAVSCV